MSWGKKMKLKRIERINKRKESREIKKKAFIRRLQKKINNKVDEQDDI